MAKGDKKPGKALIPWEQEMAADAKKQTAAPVAGGGDRTFISLKGGVMMYGDQRVKENKLDCIVLDFAYVNAYYDKPFNPKAPASPACYAIGRDKGELAPHKDAEDKQNDQCAGCEMNEFGSAPDGRRGKACKNGLRLVLMSASDLSGDIEKADVAYLNVPVTSVKAFGAFMREELADEKGDIARPIYSVVTEIECEPHPDWQFTLNFTRAKGTIDRETYYKLRNKVQKLADDILFPFPKQEDRAPAKAAPKVVGRKR